MARKIITSILPTEDNTQLLQEGETETVLRTIVGSIPILEDTTEEEVSDILTIRKVVSAVSEPVISAEIIPESSGTLNPDDNLLNLIAELDEGENQSSSTGFSLSFTDDSVYDLDEIITNIKRNNSDIPLVMQVNFENTIVLTVTSRIISELLELYSAESVEYILDFDTIFLKYFRDHFEEYAEDAKTMTTEGGMALDEKHEKVQILRSDLKKYMLNDVPNDGPVNPITDAIRTLSLWYECTDGDLTDGYYETGSFDQVLFEVLDGGTFLNSPESDYDGGEF